MGVFLSFESVRSLCQGLPPLLGHRGPKGQFYQTFAIPEYSHSATVIYKEGRNRTNGCIFFTINSFGQRRQSSIKIDCGMNTTSLYYRDFESSPPASKGVEEKTLSKEKDGDPNGGGRRTGSDNMRLSSSGLASCLVRLNMHASIMDSI
jgi:hypothetical protein